MEIKMERFGNGKELFIALFVAFGFFLSVEAQKVRYVYNGPDGCRSSFCDCVKEKTYVKDKNGFEVLLINTTCKHRDNSWNLSWPFTASYFGGAGWFKALAADAVKDANDKIAAQISYLKYFVNMEPSSVQEDEEDQVTGSESLIQNVDELAESESTIQIEEDEKESLSSEKATPKDEEEPSSGNVTLWVFLKDKTIRIGGKAYDTVLHTLTELATYYFFRIKEYIPHLLHFSMSQEVKSAPAPLPQGRKPPAGKVAMSSVIRGISKFNSRLYHILSPSTSSNILVSPLGVSTLMAMLQPGAGYTTNEILRSAMSFPENDLELLHGYQSLLRNSQNNKDDSAATLRMKSAMFVNQSVVLDPTYENVLAQHFMITPHALDFSNAGDVLIDQKDDANLLVQFDASSLSGQGKMAVVNFLEFVDFWETPFPPDQTEHRVFHTQEKLHVQVPMMNVRGEFAAGEVGELDAGVLVLPYKNNRFSMVILLPNWRLGLTSMHAKLKNFPLDQIFDRVSTKKLNIFIPQMKLESHLDLQESLSKIGLESIFSKTSDFAPATSENDSESPIFLSKAIQTIFLEVNEGGTGIKSYSGSARANENVDGYGLFYVGHPFFAMIYDNELAIPILMASVVNPGLSQANQKST